MASFFLPVVLRTVDRLQDRLLPSAWSQAARERLLTSYAAAWDRREGALFETVQIQTVTGCNLSCPFCPANRSEALYGGVGAKAQIEMSDAVFESIAEQLGILDYRGEVKLYLMNEPTLDPRLFERVRRLRAACPAAMLSLATNGVLLEEDSTLSLFSAGLDLLVVDDYSPDDRVLSRMNAWETDLPANAVVLLSRELQEPYDRLGYGLNNRAGNAPGAPVPAEASFGFCDRPFRGLYLAYNGDAVLCCSDWNFEAALGNVVDDGLLAIWQGEAYRRTRRALLAGRREGLCARCDFAGVSTSWPAVVRKKAGPLWRSLSRRVAPSG